ncbi:hypothetical protein, partial [Burkholderia cepacia]|uniref:hypothetical protein n=1 Tax=Burkholderia cepacia TaxID=292 RepID=UPI002ABD97CC
SRPLLPLTESNRLSFKSPNLPVDQNCQILAILAVLPNESQGVIEISPGLGFPAVCLYEIPTPLTLACVENRNIDDPLSILLTHIHHVVARTSESHGSQFPKGEEHSPLKRKHIVHFSTSRGQNAVLGEEFPQWYTKTIVKASK